MQPELSAGKRLQASNNWSCFISDWRMWRTRFKSPSSQSSVGCLWFPDSTAILPYLKWCSPWWQARETCIWYQPIRETALLQTPGLVSQAKTTPRIENWKNAQSHWCTTSTANSNKLFWVEDAIDLFNISVNVGASFCRRLFHIANMK